MSDGDFSAEDRREFRSEMAPVIERIVAEADHIREPWLLERFATGLVPLLMAADGPPGMAGEFIDLIAEIPGCASLLTAVAAIAAPPISTVAHAHLPSGGEPSGAARRVGSLIPREGWMLGFEGESVDAIFLAARRPRARNLQLFCFTRDALDLEGGLRDGFFTDPLSYKEVVEDVIGAHDPEGVRPRTVPVEEAVGAIVAAARCNIAIGIAPTGNCLQALVLLLRAAQVPDADQLLQELAELRSLDLPDDYDDDDELDDDEFDAVDLDDDDDEVAMRDAVDGFAEGFAEWLIGRESDPDRVDHAAWIAHAMADFRVSYQGGSPVSWTPGDVADFLLDHAPRKISFEDDSIAMTPWAVAMALRYAGEEHLLPNAARLASYAESLQKEFLERARDPRAWGMAKTLAMQMRADDIDMEDGGAVDAWIAAFNERPFDERAALTPMPSDHEARPRPARRRKPTAGRRNRRARGR